METVAYRIYDRNFMKAWQSLGAYFSFHDVIDPSDDWAMAIMNMILLGSMTIQDENNVHHHKTTREDL